MYYLLLSGLKEDVKKVSLARLLHHKGELSLSKAKETVDELLIGKKYVMVFSNRKKVELLKNEAILLGAEMALFTDKTLSRLSSLRTTSDKTLIEI